ncbi:MAG TPA: YajQ family cyclic di-GMP-binding protein [Oligoflexia bacterium]|nr:YajQ family cyclic di-GMP-binding protein [Oligoflexia bacterium]HMR23982.1 YajQ family cyclic di-GMP-binding protein [Oligoflexia bacterium]
MPSFDIVNEIDFAEIDNALNQANKELTQRFDFKGSNTTIERKDKEIMVNSADDYKVQAAVDVLQAKLAKRSVSLKSLELGKIEPAASGRAKQNIKVLEGIEKDKAKELIKTIKDSKLKVQASIQGETVRVTGKKRDDLQEVITLLKSLDFSLPLQFNNFRD